MTAQNIFFFQPIDMQFLNQQGKKKKMLKRKRKKGKY